jgi:3-dehydroquinate synthase
MKSITVTIPHQEYSYEVQFSQDFDILEQSLRKQIQKRNFLIVTDSSVSQHTEFLNRFGENEYLVLEKEKDQKNWTSLEKILTACFQKNIDRSSVLIALGGGVIGDMTGLAASLYMRGIPVIQIPTTLLAMVDASIGGKTAINCEFGKNLIGTFHQPEKIFCCQSFLSTLPESEIKNGLCEMIKHGIIASEKHFSDLANIATPHPTAEQVFRFVPDSIQIKTRIVERDVRESGTRMALNLGHTFGHAIELLSKMKIPHGRAVAIGCVMAANYAVQHTMCDSQTADRIQGIFDAFGIDLSCEFSTSKIWKAMKHDKKCLNGRIRLIVPKKIGSVEVVTV